jgi:hypothetical protein
MWRGGTLGQLAAPSRATILFPCSTGSVFADRRIPGLPLCCTPPDEWAIFSPSDLRPDRIDLASPIGFASFQHQLQHLVNFNGPPDCSSVRGGVIRRSV